MKHSLTLVALIIAVITFQSCKEPKPDDKPKNETELITSCILEFTDSSSGSKKIIKFRDPDGSGGNTPIQFDSIRLNTNRTYTCKLSLLDESKTPVSDISSEILEEADDHLFVYLPQFSNVIIQITDKDNKNLPLGLLTKWRTGNTSSGTVKIVLKHQPEIKDGTSIPGTTDVDLEFHCIIE